MEEVNAFLKAASEEAPLKGILGFETEQLVSTDYVNDPRSGIVDADCTQARNSPRVCGAAHRGRAARVACVSDMRRAVSMALLLCAPLCADV